MPKLTRLKPRLGSLSPRLGYPTGDEKARDKHRSATQPWRRWYKTARWIKLRQQVLIRDLYTCQMCRKVVSGKGEAHVDHKQPHRGDAVLFHDIENLQVLCVPCHNSVKQSEERSAGLNR